MGYIHCFVVLILNVGIGSANEHNLDLIMNLLYEECVHIKRSFVGGCRLLLTGVLSQHQIVHQKLV